MMVLPVMLLAAAVSPKPIGDPGAWITSDDYPAGALERAQAGATIVELVIDGAGRVSQCRTEGSRGSIELDATACALIKARGKFTPAKDAMGKRVEGVYRQRVAWVVPKNIFIPLPSKAEILAIAVDVDQKGLVERCQVTEGAEMVAQGKPSPCIRFQVGAKLRQAAGQDGEPAPYRILVRQVTEVSAR